MIHQFTVHENLPAGSPRPSCQAFDLYDKLLAGKALSRQEKDRVAELLYGIGSSHSCWYKCGGFLAPFDQVLPRYLVLARWGGWRAYWAPDKTSLRKALTGQGDPIVEIHELPQP